MEIKKREIPSHLLGLATLALRVSKSDNAYERIVSDYRNSRSGYAGELKVDRYLEDLELKNPYYTLQDLNYKIGKKDVQIDTIIVHPHFILVIEIKNMRGEFYFDPTHKHFYRVTESGEKEGMRNPEAQLSRATKAINFILQRMGFEAVSEGVIVFVSRAGIVIQGSQVWKTLPLDSLVGYLEYLEVTTKPIFSNETCKGIAFKLREKSIVEKIMPLVEYYRLPAASLQKGVRCLKCNFIPMKRIKINWYCGACGTKFRDAHIVALQEYRLLFGSEITSQKAFEFLQHDSRYFAIRMLNKHAVATTEKKRYRFFNIPEQSDLLKDFIVEEMKK